MEKKMENEMETGGIQEPRLPWTFQLGVAQFCMLLSGSACAVPFSAT